MADRPTGGPMPAIETPPTAQRSATMRAIKGKGTKPELALEAALLALGHPADSRNDRSLPGSPDFVFRKARLAVFVDSAFWHGRGNRPKTNSAWWAEKLARNAERDRRADLLLREMGWLPWRIDAEFVRKSPEAAACAAKAIYIRRLLKMRTVILYFAEAIPPGTDQLAYHPVAVDGTIVGYVRGQLAPPGTSDSDALDLAEPLVEHGETLLNTFELQAQPDGEPDGGKFGQPAEAVDVDPYAGPDGRRHPEPGAAQ
jgi:DNA mismatch endonuclease (patch repair protein)